MKLKRLELTGFKSFAKKTEFLFEAPVTAIVGPNGSGKSNCAEAFRWVLGERSLKSLRGARGEDLIFNGGAPRLGRAAVTLVFDNRDRQFKIDFDEVALTREVYRDGQNAYLVNGSAVRYRDLVELLAGGSLGASDHYIVNQGDADRLLKANERERRVMIEDALGLRLYQWKIEESERKLKQTEENLRQVESLRRELAPHLKFLRKQIEKIEQADRWRQELKQLYFEYLVREAAYLGEEEQLLAGERAGPRAELEAIERQLMGQSGQAADPAVQKLEGEIGELDNRLAELTRTKDDLARRLGRLEGLIEAKKAVVNERPSGQPASFSYEQVSAWLGEARGLLAESAGVEDPGRLKEILARLREWTDRLLATGPVSASPASSDLEHWEQELAQLAERSAELVREMEAARAMRAERVQALGRATATAHERERAGYELRARKSELVGRLSALAAREEKWQIESADFKREVAEGAALVDIEIKRYDELGPKFNSLPVEARTGQEARRRAIAKLKLRLEDLGVEGGETIKEYQAASEREQFLTKELADLETSAAGLRQVSAELGATIDREFNEGLAKINDHFQNFFALMFGGGEASLKLIKEKARQVNEENLLEGLPSVTPEEIEGVKEGVEIRVSLPRKKIRGLEMLSGGERALTSIALLFALSQVNPPPFLILDETDAALDEANARKYGELVESLAQHSQLVLITHNRETMSRAGVIYGITMGSDGVSKQLSIKFDEAANYAK